MSIGLEILIIALLILGNGVFAMSEMALTASRKARLQVLLEAGEHGVIGFQGPAEILLRVLAARAHRTMRLDDGKLQRVA